MSGFALVPVDGGDPVQLPPGETVLGRGPLLGVGDKRVSRNHALLEILDGELRLKSGAVVIGCANHSVETHLNPCFVQSSPTDDPRPLQRNSWHPLHQGDFFSLLPGQFIYQVVSVGEEDRTPRNSQMFEEEEEEEGLPDCLQPEVEQPRPPAALDRGQTPPQEEPEAAAQSDMDDVDSRPKTLDKSGSVPPAEIKQEHRNPPPAARRRVLPAWMMKAAAPSSSGAKVPSALKRSKAPAAASTSSKRAAARQPAAPADISEEEEEEEEEELSAQEQPRKRRRKKSDAEGEARKSKTDAPSKRPAAQPPEVSDESDGINMEADEDRGGGEMSTDDLSAVGQKSAPSNSENGERKVKNGGQASKRGESVGSNSSAAPSKPRLRTPCPYGKDCYRKNPIHFQESSHPGDTDYEEEEEETGEADLPECPYGTDCYRKNPLHRKEYKHTRKPAPMPRTRPKKRPAYDDDEDEDEDSGDEDSFINDDSEEGGDDSDYVPPVSDDSDKEDIRGLQREAENFLKKRK